MKKLLAAVIFFCVLLGLAVLWYFFGTQILALFNRDTSAPIDNSDQTQERPLSKEEQRAMLDDLLPENLVDTQEEIDEQVKLLEQLRGDNSQNQLDQLEVLQGNSSEQEQIELLEQLKNQ